MAERDPGEYGGNRSPADDTAEFTSHQCGACRHTGRQTGTVESVDRETDRQTGTVEPVDREGDRQVIWALTVRLFCPTPQ